MEGKEGMLGGSSITGGFEAFPSQRRYFVDLSTVRTALRSEALQHLYCR